MPGGSSCLLEHRAKLSYNTEKSSSALYALGSSCDGICSCQGTPAVELSTQATWITLASAVPCLPPVWLREQEAPQHYLCACQLLRKQ